MSDVVTHSEPLALTESESHSPATCSSSAGPSADAPDLAEADRLLRALAPTGVLTFQSLPDRRENRAGRRSLNPNSICHGSFANKSDFLRRLNEEGSGVFVMVNEGDGKGRSTENVKKVRAVFVDLDGADIQPVLDANPPPSITVESSPGRFHAYWLVRDMSVREFKSAQQKLAAMFDGDKAVNDLPRIMRIPGFLHQKSDVPFRSRLIRCEPELVWDWGVLAEGLGLPKIYCLPTEIPEGERHLRLLKAAGSAAVTGTSKAACLSDLLRLNEERCKPPLTQKEVTAIVEGAFKNPCKGELKIPLALFSDAQFLRLSSESKLLLILIYMRVVAKPADTEIAVLWKDFSQHFRRENSFKKYRRSLVEHGLLVQTKFARRKFPGGTADYNLYRIAISGS